MCWANGISHGPTGGMDEDVELPSYGYFQWKLYDGPANGIYGQQLAVWNRESWSGTAGGVRGGDRSGRDRCRSTFHTHFNCFECFLVAKKQLEKKRFVIYTGKYKFCILYFLLLMLIYGFVESNR